jgi:outer membrane protein OmpA-like peptidoglycan-associated protein
LSGGALLATGCAMSNPSRNAARTPEQKAALRSLGFVEGREGWEFDLAARVSFAVDEASLSPDAEATLTRIARVLLGVGIDGLTVDGHSDTQGSDEYNQRLSERRADVVAEALIARGLARERTIRRAFGATRPVATNATEAGRRLNRRAVLLVPFA